MAKKDVIVKVTVSNAGLCFEDDVDFALVTVPTEMEIYKLQNYIEKTDKELRKENKLSQTELADAVGTTRQTITSIEVGKYTASLGLAYKIAHYFNLTIEEVFDFSNLED